MGLGQTAEVGWRACSPLVWLEDVSPRPAKCCGVRQGSGAAGAPGGTRPPHCPSVAPRKVVCLLEDLGHPVCGEAGGTLVAVPPWDPQLWDAAGRRRPSPSEHPAASTSSSRDPKLHHHPQEHFLPSISMTTLGSVTAPPFQIRSQILGFSLLFLPFTLSPAAVGSGGPCIPRLCGVHMGGGWWHPRDPAAMLCPLPGPCSPARSHPSSPGDASEKGCDPAAPRCCRRSPGFSSRSEFARLPPGSSAPVRADDATPSRLPPAFLDYISVREIF